MQSGHNGETGNKGEGKGKRGGLHEHCRTDAKRGKDFYRYGTYVTAAGIFPWWLYIGGSDAESRFRCKDFGTGRI